MYVYKYNAYFIFIYMYALIQCNPHAPLERKNIHVIIYILVMCGSLTLLSCFN